ncbi:MAG: TetR family transcriptional regulator [Hymenobacter sp.]|nr:TetR family transcriptional regulator [Hymenobacter sp.]
MRQAEAKSARTGWERQKENGNFEYNESFRCIFAALVMEIKDRILNHAQKLFLRNGIKSVSMDDIAADMAMSKKTLYKWFENKDQIVMAGITQHLNGVQGDCAVVAGKAADAVEEMLLISKWADEQFADIHPSIFNDMKKYHPAAWELFRSHKNTFILAQITENLRRGMAEGLFRPDLDVEVLARLSLAQIELAFDPELYPPAQFSPMRVNQVFDEHFLLGVATLKGHKLINQYRHITEAE